MTDLVGNNAARGDVPGREMEYYTDLRPPRKSPQASLLPAGLSLMMEESKPSRLVIAMIKGVHTMFYTSEPEQLRAFLRDKLGFSHTDVGDGWLIFDLPEADMGCHPAAPPPEGAPSGTHNISFYCDDIKKTVAELKQRGVEFVDEIADHGYGLVTHFKMPGGFDVQLYEPRYEKKAKR